MFVKTRRFYDFTHSVYNLIWKQHASRASAYIMRNHVHIMHADISLSHFCFKRVYRLTRNRYRRPPPCLRHPDSCSFHRLRRHCRYILFWSTGARIGAPVKGCRRWNFRSWPEIFLLTVRIDDAASLPAENHGESAER